MISYTENLHCKIKVIFYREIRNRSYNNFKNNTTYLQDILETKKANLGKLPTPAFEVRKHGSGFWWILSVMAYLGI